MAKLAKPEFTDEDRERLAVTLEELAGLIRGQPDRLMEVKLSWHKEHPPRWIDDATYRKAPVSYSFSLTLAPDDEALQVGEDA